MHIENEMGDIALGLPLSSEGKVTHSSYSGLGPGGELVQESNFNDRGDESGLLLQLAGFGLYKQTYCKRLCRSLGYEKREKLGGDKSAFSKCKNDCVVHFKEIKKKKYKINPATPKDPEVDLDAIDSETSKETGVKPTAEDVERSAPTPEEIAAAGGGGNKTMIYVLIGVVLLVIIIAAVMMMRKKPAA